MSRMEENYDRTPPSDYVTSNGEETSDDDDECSMQENEETTAENEDSNIVYRGILLKKGYFNTTWRERLFILRKDRRIRYYDPDPTGGKKNGVLVKGEILLSEIQSCQVVPHIKNCKEFEEQERHNTTKRKKRKTACSEEPNSFEIVTSGRIYLLAALQEEETETWIKKINKLRSSSIRHTGYLYKRGANWKNWYKRFFVLNDTYELRYYTDSTCGHRKGYINLNQCLLLAPDYKVKETEYVYTIQMMTPARNWVFCASNPEDRQGWLDAIEKLLGGAKRLHTIYEGFLYERKPYPLPTLRSFFIPKTYWKKRYYALAKGWLFYFETEEQCSKFKSILFFSEAFFNQSFRLYVKGSKSLRDTTIQRIKTKSHNTFKNEFSIKSASGSVQKYACDTTEEMKKWLKSFDQIHSPSFGLNAFGLPKSLSEDDDSSDESDQTDSENNQSSSDESDDE